MEMFIDVSAVKLGMQRLTFVYGDSYINLPALNPKIPFDDQASTANSANLAYSDKAYPLKLRAPSTYSAAYLELHPELRFMRQPLGSRVTLSYTKNGTGDIRVWTQGPTGTEILGDGTTTFSWTNGDTAPTVIVEGVSPSSSSDDVILTLSYQAPPSYGSGATPAASPTTQPVNSKMTVDRPQVRVDANRDGTISFADTSDVTSADHPYRFWLNTDVEDKTSTTKSSVPSLDNPSSNPLPDYLSDTIKNTRDLTDFARLEIKPPADFIADSKLHPLGDWKVTAQLIGSTGLPEIKLFRAASKGFDYLTNQTAADVQCSHTPLATQDGGISFGYNDTVSNILSSGSSETSVPISLDDARAGVLPFLFEAGSAGNGKLVFKFYKLGLLAGSDSLYLSLHDIKNMYEVWTLADNNGNPVGDTTEFRNPRNVGQTPAAVVPFSTNVAPTIDSGPTDDLARSLDSQDYTLFVHGWRMKTDERRAFAEAAYKRLYWQGYKGRFGMFSWPTEWMDTEALPGGFPNVFSARVVNNFNNSEMKAYASAGALRTLINSLDAGHYSVNLYAHSMGNIVASEALRQEAVLNSTANQTFLHTYVASQAAVSAAAYNPDVLNNPANVSWYGSNSDAIIGPDIYSHFTAGGLSYFGGIGRVAGRIYNFFNPNDGAIAALTAWPLNQYLKPSTETPLDYRYDPETGHFIETNPRILGLGIHWRKDLNLADPYDAYAVMAYAAPSRSKGLGAVAGVAAPFNTAGEVNLKSAFNSDPKNNFTSSRDDHSGQFNLDYPQRHMYWHVLMQRFGLSPIDDGTPNIGGDPRP